MESLEKYKKTLEEFKKFFRIEEVVSQSVLNKYGEAQCWSFFDPRLLEVMVYIRKGLKKSITINDWLWGGDFDERGLRENTSPIFKSATLKNSTYLSPHVRAAAFDFDVKGMDAESVRSWIRVRGKHLPHPVRMEHKKGGKPINWVHLDVDYILGNDVVHMFNV